MTDSVTSIKIAGLGGMGVLKSSLILAELLFRRGYDVKKAEVHGMSQRGGSICSDVRFGKKVFSPMIPAGALDYLLVFQEDQLPLYQDACSNQTVVLTPEQIEIAKLENPRCLNVAMLGLLSRRLEIPVEDWKAMIRTTLAQKLHQTNEAAFDLGRQGSGSGGSR